MVVPRSLLHGPPRLPVLSVRLGRQIARPRRPVVVADGLEGRRAAVLLRVLEVALESTVGQSLGARPVDVRSRGVSVRWALRSGGVLFLGESGERGP